MKSLISSLKTQLSKPRNDGMLHFSQHLQHDRHTAIYHKYGYPHVMPSWGNLFPLVQGSGIHEIMHATMKSLYSKYYYEMPIVLENETEYTWCGTIDAYVVTNTNEWIIDYKTISGAGMSFLNDEPKADHVLQVSAYAAFYDLNEKPLKTGVLYLPSSPDYKRVWSEPVFMEFEPFTKDNILARMRSVEAKINDYAETGNLPDAPKGVYVWKKKYKYFQLVYKPHYTSMFCPWQSLDNDPCGCSKDTFKIVAEWKKGTLTVEDGYDKIVEDIGLPNEVLEETKE